MGRFHMLLILEHHLPLHLGHVGPEAAVGAAAEGEDARGAPVDVEAV